MQVNNKLSACIVINHMAYQWRHPQNKSKRMHASTCKLSDMSHQLLLVVHHDLKWQAFHVLLVHLL